MGRSCASQPVLPARRLRVRPAISFLDLLHLPCLERRLRKCHSQRSVMKEG